MPLDEALAIYLYLQHVPPERRDKFAFERAWHTICEYAQSGIGHVVRPAADLK